MGKIEDLKQQLLEAEKQQILDYRLKELIELRRDFQGKCFGTHTFTRNSTASYMSAKYYEHFFTKGDKIYVREHLISLSKFNNSYKKSKDCVNYSRTIAERDLTMDGDKNANYNLDSGYSYYKHEIPYLKFMQLWEVGKDVDIMVKEAFTKELPEIHQELISQGDHSDEEKYAKCIADTGIDIIDFKLHPKVHNIIQYRTLPLFYERRWMPKLYAKPILEWKINQIKKEMCSVFATERRIAHDTHAIDVIQKFIDTDLV